jgi:hypothetical protein
MEFVVNHTEVKAPNGDRAFGFEIQPPLDTVGAESVVAELAKKEVGFSAGRSHLAEEAVVTRNDKVGTAMLVRPNSSYRSLSSGDVARAIAGLVDPCGIHKPTFEPSLES